LKFLLDTHLLLWWLANDPRLPTGARALIADPANTILVSAVSLWEIWLKKSLGKLEIPSDFDRRLEAEPLEHLPLRVGHARQVGLLPWHHRDPFDRMLVAQAQIENLILLTSDAAVQSYGRHVRVVR
jgi:PIN domain nuclease of toxin-antitoxin system